MKEIFMGSNRLGRAGETVAIEAAKSFHHEWRASPAEQLSTVKKRQIRLNIDLQKDAVKNPVKG